MKRTYKFILAGALSAFALVGTGCKDTRDYDDRGVGGSPRVGDDRIGDNEGVINDGEGPIESTLEEEKAKDDLDGTGGSGRIGDGKIGENNGVIDDGEGPLEGDGKADDKIGDKPGVWNDGEGPVEQSPMDRPEAQ